MANKKVAKKFRGRTSLSPFEVLGLSNKQAFIGFIVLIGGYLLLRYYLKKRTSA